MADDMDFSQALIAMKAGKRTARRSWLVDGKWVALRTGYPNGIAVNGNTAEAFGVPEGTLVSFQPYFQMCERDGSVRTWNKGDQDLIGEDWYIVEGSGNLTSGDLMTVSDEAFGAFESPRPPTLDEVAAQEGH